MDESIDFFAPYFLIKKKKQTKKQVATPVTKGVLTDPQKLTIDRTSTWEVE